LMNDSRKLSSFAICFEPSIQGRYVYASGFRILLGDLLGNGSGGEERLDRLQPLAGSGPILFRNMG